uniref:Acyl-coenzyme A diphosphatase NUDT19 n=1 Tax=Salvator merianae TaxID=96440 RepID=A0A8D0DUU0_SALMN
MSARPPAAGVGIFYFQSHRASCCAPAGRWGQTDSEGRADSRAGREEEVEVRFDDSPFRASSEEAMNSRLRHWREAATVLLAARRGAGAADGASSSSSGPFDYELLMLRRSGRSAFMPSAHVFPGGVADAADFSADWLALLPAGAPRCGLSAVRAGAPRAPLFTAERPELGEAALPGDVALRICAIRETFEEAGVLLLVPAGAQGAALAAAPGPATLLPPERLPPPAELAEWRRRVQRQPGSFLQLCRRLRCAPNIWALHEWNNWLTPIGRPGAVGREDRRFDTAFYVCCLGQRAPSASLDQAEVTAYQWSMPSEAIELFKSQKIWIPPPQLYELYRLCNFSSLSDLHKFASERALEGCERWMSVLLIAPDGFIQLLPGDELYPEDPDFTGERKPVLTTHKKIEDIMKEANRLHRIVTQGLSNVTIHVNIEPQYKHINPFVMNSNTENNTDSNSNSRL